MLSISKHKKHFINILRLAQNDNYRFINSVLI